MRRWFSWSGIPTDVKKMPALKKYLNHTNCIFAVRKLYPYSKEC